MLIGGFDYPLDPDLGLKYTFSFDYKINALEYVDPTLTNTPHLNTGVGVGNGQKTRLSYGSAYHKDYEHSVAYPTSYVGAEGRQYVQFTIPNKILTLERTIRNTNGTYTRTNEFYSIQYLWIRYARLSNANKFNKNVDISNIQLELGHTFGQHHTEERQEINVPMFELYSGDSIIMSDEKIQHKQSSRKVIPAINDNIELLIEKDENGNTIHGIKFVDILDESYDNVLGDCTMSNKIGETTINGITIGKNDKSVYWHGICDYLGFNQDDGMLDSF